MSRQKSFARFVAAPENRSALNAVEDLVDCLQQGKSPSVNPLYLHGPPGSGKTHLVEMLARDLATLRRDVTICLISAGDVREGEPDGARESDLVVLEDVQHLPPHAEVWLIGMLDDRLRRGRATIFTALVGPRHLSHRGNRFSSRLTNRFTAGLVIALEPLQTPSRLQFLEEMAQRRQLALGRDILNWLSDNLTGGGRQLEGAVAQLETMSKLRPHALDLKTVAAHFRPQVEATRPTVDRIARQVGGYFRIEPKQLQSRRRHRSVLLPRQVGMYLTRQLTRLSLMQIGAYFGGRDHTTVLHACRKVELALKDDAVLSGAVREIHAELA
ncbi:MAG: AAA family ATPase [Planctomycetes bacterium]|nr:AAA family ATPase [Planctomycetota bacterium]